MGQYVHINNSVCLLVTTPTRAAKQDVIWIAQMHWRAQGPLARDPAGTFKDPT